MSSAFGTETVLDVRHWTRRLLQLHHHPRRRLPFRERPVRDDRAGGPQPDGTRKPLLRAYSIASANWEEQLEFFSIKVPNGPLTSRLQHIQPGDTVLIGRKPTGTLLIHDLHPGPQPVPARHRHRPRAVAGDDQGPGDLRALRQGRPHATACATRSDLAYRDYIVNELPRHEFLGEQIARQAAVLPGGDARGVRVRRPRPARPPDRPAGQRPHDAEQLGLAAARSGARPRHDLRQPADAGRLPRASSTRRGFSAAPRIGVPGQYVFERAFVEK